MRVVQVVAPATNGGIETVVKGLSSGLARRGSELVVFALGRVGNEHPWISAVRQLGVRVEIASSSGNGLLADIQRLRRLVREFRPDIVHSHGYRADVVASFALNRTLRWISTVHGFTDETLRVRAYKWLDLQVLKRADRIIVVAETLRSLLESARFPNAATVLIRNALPAFATLEKQEAAATLGITGNADDPVIGWIGRVSHEKGLDQLFDALKSVSIRARVAVIGDGPQLLAIREKYESDPAQHQVFWCGARQEAARFIRAFDLLTLTSRSEGTPMVVLEAMAARVPVVAFDVGDVGVLLGNGAGWVVPARSNQAFAKAVEEALTSPQLQAKHTDTAYDRFVNSFSEDQWLDLHEEAYARAMEKRRSVWR